MTYDKPAGMDYLTAEGDEQKFELLTHRLNGTVYTTTVDAHLQRFYLDMESSEWLPFPDEWLSACVGETASGESNLIWMLFNFHLVSLTLIWMLFGFVPNAYHIHAHAHPHKSTPTHAHAHTHDTRHTLTPTQVGTATAMASRRRGARKICPRGWATVRMDRSPASHTPSRASSTSRSWRRYPCCVAACCCCAGCCGVGCCCVDCCCVCCCGVCCCCVCCCGVCCCCVCCCGVGCCCVCCYSVYNSIHL